MRICRDKQIRGFFLFLTFFAVLLFGLGIIFGISQINDIKTLYLTHDEAVASSLLEQGIPKDVIAVALTNTTRTDKYCWRLLALGQTLKIICYHLLINFSSPHFIPCWAWKYFYF